MDNYFDAPNNNKKRKINNNIKLKDSKTLDCIVNNICEMKKKEMLIISCIDEETNINKLLIASKKSTDYKLNELICTEIVDNKILSLSELKNGNLLMVQTKQFKIYEINRVGFFNNIQTVTINDIIEFKQIIELVNRYLVSISLNQNNKSEIIFWKQNLISGYYEKEKTIEKDKAMSITEFNKTSFLVYFKDDDIYSFNSNTGKQHIIGNIKTEFPKNIIKMILLGENNILLVYQECIGLLNLTSLMVRYLSNAYNNICPVPFSCNNLIASFSEKIKKKKYNNLYLIRCNLSNNGIKDEKYFENPHTNIIKCIYPLKNGDIITCSLDKTIKIWKIID